LRALLLGCLALAALSLLLPSAPTYDPWAWIVWGREIAHLDLVTTGGPSWKPLPVLFTTPFSVLGDVGAPAAWLVVARAGGLLSFAMAYRLGARLAGPVAGAIAAAALVLTDQFIRNFARGNSEGILVAVVLWAVERHLDGRRRQAFALGVAAALLRPEVWPFIALYGLWLLWSAWRDDPQRRPPARELALVGAAGAVLALLWFLPEYVGSGELLRAAARARQPNPDSAAYAAFPFVEVFRRSETVLSPPVYASAAIAVAAALAARLRGRDGGLPLALAAGSTALMVAVAAMTQAGFAGNLRYVVLPAALVCVLAGAGWVWLVRAAAARAGRRAAVLLTLALAAGSVPFVRADIGSLSAQWRNVEAEADVYGPSMRAVVAKAGGPGALKSCGQVYTGALETQALAWYLHLHGDDIEIWPFPPGTTISVRRSHLSRDPRFTMVVETPRWIVASTCARPPT
jgi:hypothetical protein